MGEKILEFIKADDAQQGCKDLVDAFGIYVFISLIEYCGGSNIYIQSKGVIVKKARNRIIKEKFNGGNYKEVAKRFGISEVQVRSIVK